MVNIKEEKMKKLLFCEAVISGINFALHKGKVFYVYVLLTDINAKYHLLYLNNYTLTTCPLA